MRSHRSMTSSQPRRRASRSCSLRTEPPAWRALRSSSSAEVRCCADAALSPRLGELRIGERDTPAPPNVYGSSKLAGEAAVLAADPDALVIRTNVVWGPEGAPLPTPAQTVPAIAAIRHAEGREASGGAPSEAGFMCSCAPPEEHAASLMLRVTAPEFQGDGHTKWLLQHPETYAVRRVLAEQLIRSFFGVLWNEFHPLRPKVKLHVMAGPHAERALVKVHGSHWCWAEQGLAPAIPSKSKLGSVFLYNVEAVTLRRADLVSFFSSQVTPVVEPAEMTMRMRALGDGQAHLTEKAQAGTLRSYTVLFK